MFLLGNFIGSIVVVLINDPFLFSEYPFLCEPTLDEERVLNGICFVSITLHSFHLPAYSL